MFTFSFYQVIKIRYALDSRSTSQTRHFSRLCSPTGAGGCHTGQRSSPPILAQCRFPTPCNSYRGHADSVRPLYRARGACCQKGFMPHWSLVSLRLPHGLSPYSTVPLGREAGGRQWEGPSVSFPFAHQEAQSWFEDPGGVPPSDLSEPSFSSISAFDV